VNEGRRAGLLAGGTYGNELLTAITCSSACC
jgi:hypothetical protein